MATNLSKADVSYTIGAVDNSREGIESAKKGQREFASSAESMGSQVAASYKKIAVGLASVTAAVYSAKKAWDLAQEAAKFYQSMQAFNIQVEALGRNATAEFNRIRQASAGMIDNNSLVEASNRALALGIPLEQIGSLMEIARAKSRDMGITTSKAFEDIVTGVGRGSAMIIDNLGITLKLGDAYAKYAATLNKTSAELTSAEQKQALLNAVIDAGAASVQRHNLEQLTMAERMQQINAELENLKLQIGAGIVRVALGAQGAFQWLASGALTATAGVMKLIQGFTWLTDKVGLTENASAGWAESAEIAFAAAEEQAGKAAESFQMAAEKSEILMGAYNQAADSARNLADANRDAAASTGPRELTNEEMEFYAKEYYRAQDLAAEEENKRMIEYANELYRSRELAAEEENARMIAYAKEFYAAKEMAAEEKKRQFMVQNVSSGFGTMAKLADSFYKLSDGQNKAAFKAYQAFSIAQAVVDTYGAANAAYKAMAGIPIVGPALGAAAAAAAILAGLARVKAIAAAKPGNAAVGASGSSASGSVPSLATTAPPPPPTQAQTAPRQINVTINAHGALRTPEDIVEHIKKPLMDAVEDNDIVFNTQVVPA